MKKLLIVLMVLAMMLVLGACGTSAEVIDETETDKIETTSEINISELLVDINKELEKSFTENLIAKASYSNKNLFIDIFVKDMALVDMPEIANNDEMAGEWIEMCNSFTLLNTSYTEALETAGIDSDSIIIRVFDADDSTKQIAEIRDGKVYININ